MIDMDLSHLIETRREELDARLDVISYPAAFSGVTATARFHHLRLDGNGQPMVRDLARLLSDYAVEFCLSIPARGNPTRPVDYTRLARRAKALFRRTERAGDVGEVLLYFLIEAILGAPQMVARMDLKTSSKMELHGSDGVHMKWDAAEMILDVFYGESKVEKSAANALSNAFASIEQFHLERQDDREVDIVTSHYKHAEDDLKKAILEIVTRNTKAATSRINHACLIGFDAAEYDQATGATRSDLEASFRSAYTADAPRLVKLLQKRFDAFERKHLRFEVFFLPVPSVQAFRDEFHQALD